MERPKAEADDNDSQPSYRDTDRGAAVGRLRPDTRPGGDWDGPRYSEAPNLQGDGLGEMTPEEIKARLAEFRAEMARKFGWK
jgi:hypothetical protein